MIIKDHKYKPSQSKGTLRTETNKIILYDSYRKDSSGMNHLLIKDSGFTKVWPHYTITRDGEIYEHVDVDQRTDFFSDKKIDNESVHIVLENMNSLLCDEDNNVYVNSLFQTFPYDEKFIYHKDWFNEKCWEKYRTKQIKSLVNLLKTLCEKYNIREYSGMNFFEQSYISFKGVISRSNIDRRYKDINPSFNWKRLNFLDNEE